MIFRVRELPASDTGTDWAAAVFKDSGAFVILRFVVHSMHPARLRFKGTECPQSLSQADFVLDTYFPKWEHFICIGAIPMQVYASNIEKTVA